MSSDEGEPEESRAFPWMISLSLSEKLQGFGRSSCLLKKEKEHMCIYMGLLWVVWFSYDLVGL